jgi:deoxyribodipyrimidine photolyase-related protein
MRTLVLVLGDQLQPDHPLLRDADRRATHVVMAEARAEVGRHPNHRQRVLVFLAAMRAFAQAREAEGWPVHYQRLGGTSLASIPEYVAAIAQQTSASRVRVLEPGRHSLHVALQRACDAIGVPLEVVPNPHFTCSTEAFTHWAKGRKTLLMETFYRAQRKRLDVLMDGKKPRGGTWNYDHDNRRAFGKEGPGLVRPPHLEDNDTAALLREVEADCEAHGIALVGTADTLHWPITPEQAQHALDDFIAHRLPSFGDYQDAMWTGQPWLYHSRLSVALNLQLIDPRTVVQAAVDALDAGHAPINAVEGFVRQVIGWREFIRGVYHLEMPGRLEDNALDATRPLPALYWTGETSMRCLRDVVEQLLETGYAHHIQRLMVAGLFAQLAAVDPAEVHDWFMALFVDSVEWVTLPNVVGMSQYADGGVVGSKPYIATGAYIARQSNYCTHCKYDPKLATGDRACPFTTLYWAFLDRHATAFRDHPRMALQVRNLDRKSEEELQAIRVQAAAVHDKLDAKQL